MQERETRVPDETVAERIRSALPDLTRAERQVAHVLLGRAPLAGLETVQALARRSGVSTASVLRFVAKLGFASYADFQQALRSQLAATLQSPLSRYPAALRDRPDDREGMLARYFRDIRGRLEEALSLVPEGEFEAVADLLAEVRRPVFLLGGRYSGRVAGYLSDLLRGIRGRVHLVEGQTEKWVDRLLDMNRRSVFLCFDFRRYQKDLLGFAEGAAARGARIALITDPWHSPIERVASHLLPVPVASPSIYDSLAAAVTLAEALVSAVAHRLGEQARVRIETLERLRRAPHGESEP